MSLKDGSHYTLVAMLRTKFADVGVRPRMSLSLEVAVMVIDMKLSMITCFTSSSFMAKLSGRGVRVPSSCDLMSWERTCSTAPVVFLMMMLKAKSDSFGVGTTSLWT